MFISSWTGPAVLIDPLNSTQIPVSSPFRIRCRLAEWHRSTFSAQPRWPVCCHPPHALRRWQWHRSRDRGPRRSRSSFGLCRPLSDRASAAPRADISRTAIRACESLTPPTAAPLAGRSIIVGTRLVRAVCRKVVEQGDVTDDRDDVKHEFPGMRRARLSRFAGAAGDRREDGSSPSAEPGTVSFSGSALRAHGCASSLAVRIARVRQPTVVEGLSYGIPPCKRFCNWTLALSSAT